MAWRFRSAETPTCWPQVVSTATAAANNPGEVTDTSDTTLVRASQRVDCLQSTHHKPTPKTTQSMERKVAHVTRRPKTTRSRAQVTGISEIFAICRRNGVEDGSWKEMRNGPGRVPPS